MNWCIGKSIQWALLLRNAKVPKQVKYASNCKVIQMDNYINVITGNIMHFAGPLICF